MINRLGVTLVELLVVITIAAVLILIAVPTFRDFVKNARLSAAAEDLRTTIELARSEAIKRNATVFVSLTTGDTWCYGVNVSSACNCTVAGNCGLKTVSYDTAQQLSLSTSGMSGNSISFEGTHGSANASGTATFTLYGESTLVTLSIGRFGGVQMCSTGLSGYTAC